MSEPMRRDYPGDVRWEPLLSPIRPDQPCGSDQRGAPVYAEIKEALREDDDGDMGVWQRTRKTADWPLVSKLCTAELSRNTKDLQIAVWWMLAEIKLRGYGGLVQGLRLIEELLERYWEGLYPPLEDGDTLLRLVPLEWIGSRLGAQVRQVPLTRNGLSWFRYQESTGVPGEFDAENDEKKRRQRDEAVNEGKLTPEEFLEGLRATPDSFWQEAGEALGEAQDCLARIAAFCEPLATDEPPSFGSLRESIEEIAHTIRSLPARKSAGRDAPPPAQARRLESRDDPFANLDDQPAEDEAAAQDGDDFDPFAAIDSGGSEEAEPETYEPPRGNRRQPPQPMEDFPSALAAYARELREANPANPAPYLLTRGLRWAELRAGAPAIDPALCAGPPLELRRRLKELARLEDWQQLLDETEQAAAQPCCRAWLDLHAYTLRACRELGAEYDAVHTALAAELKRLLADLPGLADALLDDDTQAATAETRALLQELPAELNTAAREEPAEPMYPSPAGLSLPELTKRLRRQAHGRGRFHYRVRLAERFLEDDRVTPALALLRDLMQEIEDRRLLDWEKPEDLALPVRLYCEASRRAGDEPPESYLLMLAKLDPVAAAEIA